MHIQRCPIDHSDDSSAFPFADNGIDLKVFNALFLFNNSRSLMNGCTVGDAVFTTRAIFGSAFASVAQVGIENASIEAIKVEHRGA